MLFCDLEQALDTAPANNAHQNKTGLRFVADNTGETTPTTTTTTF